MSDKSNQSLVRADTMFEDQQANPPLPSHERVLLIARIALRDPAALTKDEIQELANAMIVHYAQMGIG